ncbi:2'-5' RNA ligase family protein [Lysobacter sp. KIS68-7]|uniref:2'-5' RNA ligase family protein n=1 Tax=Lysobacter sp. KIS68-7 TaxID=2904252 RepID=UPI001E5BB957|nr:2'-5' RNA ligase family protein [Lysobacter sp. KIS68-7]UHQ19260.1 2'-5' RNA ligase family protein [Lysobacter sp. KIS68-7]
MAATRNIFFAFAPEPTLRHRLALETARLHAEWGGRRTQEAKLHMTLVFLDAFPDPLPDDILRAARAAADTIALPPFDLVVDRADRFGRRIGWLGCSHLPDALQQLHDALAQACREREVPMKKEDRYVPHITALRAPRRPEPHAIGPLPWHVGHFELMASGEGAYETLGRWPLA